jgi:hypothetical protein
MALNVLEDHFHFDDGRGRIEVYGVIFPHGRRRDGQSLILITRHGRLK